jgi:hypothetical protein
MQGRPLHKPELKGWDCADYDPIETWVPNHSEVIYWLNLTIGLPGSQAEERQTRLLALSIDEREQILGCLDDPPDGLCELRAVLLQKHAWRVGDGL